jgi:hypothetical protein
MRYFTWERGLTASEFPPFHRQAGPKEIWKAGLKRHESAATANEEWVR